MKNTLWKHSKSYIILICSSLLYSIGILFTIHAGLGVSPWDAFHLGLVNHTPFTLGQTSQLVGLLIIALCIPLRQYPGLGTLFNIIFIGLFLDIIESLGVIPYASGIPQQALMLLAGILIIGWATYFYLSVGKGSGPRDGLMLGLTHLLRTPMWVMRTAIEATVLLAGFFLGGPVGMGTVLTAFAIGPSIQLAFSIMRRDPKNIKHRNILDEYKAAAAALAWNNKKEHTKTAIHK